MVAGGGPGRGGPPGNNHNPNGSIQAGDPGRNPLAIGGFKKGSVTNPAGRNGWSMAKTLRQILKRRGPTGVRNDWAIAETLIALALDRDLAALQYIFDRTDGKLANVQQVSQQISGGESPLTIAVDSYFEERVIHDGKAREIAHMLLAQMVGANVLLPDGSADAST